VRAGVSPAIASHEAVAIEWAETCHQCSGLAREAVESQMLQGMEGLQSELVGEVRPVRVCVPDGNASLSHALSNLSVVLLRSGSNRSRRS